MNLLSFIVLVIFLEVGVGADCASGDLQNTQENCIHVENLASTWQEAENFCIAHNGHLASVHNAFDMTSLRRVASGCTNFWLGGQCQSGSNCQWSDGTTFDYTNFRNGNQGSDNCVVADTKSGTWATQSCDLTSCIACEIRGKMRDCQDWLKAGYSDSGKYTILLNDKETEVYCDMSTYDGGWIVFQNRVDGSESYWDRSWDEYKNGFGTEMDLASNFWLGNEALYQLTSLADGNVTLRVEIYGDRTPNSTYTDDYWYGHYDRFLVGPEANNYTLLNIYVDWEHPVGNATTAWYDMTCSIGAQFSTVDRINDPMKECVTQFQMGGWWLHNCALSTLNGAYIPKDWSNGYGVFWIVDGADYVIHPFKTRMLLRREL